MTVELGEALRLTVQDDVLWAVIDRPHTRNAINLDVITGLEAMLATARQRRVKVVVVRGAGGTFCSGADLHELRTFIDDPSAVRSFMSRLGAVLEELERAPWATVAVVEGYAVAGGCELLLAADVVVVSTDARIGDRHAEHGLAPAAGGSVRLSRAVSPALARYLLLTGDMLSGTEAVERGLATVAVDPSRLDDEAQRIVQRLSSRGHSTLQTMKAMLADGDGRPDALQRELELFLDHVASAPDVQIGLDAFCDRITPTFDEEP